MTDVHSQPASAAAEAPLLLTAIEGGIGTITFNRPAQLNVLTRAMLTALGAQLAAWREERAVRVIVLAGQGKAFSAGHDLRELAEVPRTDVESLFALCTEVMETVRLHPKPVIAQVQGVAAAAGCQLVASCDLAVASEQARFGTTGIKAGLFCSTPMVPLSRVVPHKKALELLLTGDLIDAQEAERAGLVNHVVPHETLAEAARDLAGRIAARSPYAVRLGKAAYYRQQGQEMAEAYRIGTQAIVDNTLAPDGQEGIAAFLTKRDPRYQD
ncbi:MAG TPA: enoyl-CoA hydratase [bacterium]|nr:enoyl-CoA hydratase [bacterium]